jgi:hypothetical protein
MNKFNVGDTVIILPKNSSKDCEKLYIKEMDQYVGRIDEIYCITREGYYLLRRLPLHWPESMLESYDNSTDPTLIR